MQGDSIDFRIVGGNLSLVSYKDYLYFVIVWWDVVAFANYEEPVNVPDAWFFHVLLRYVVVDRRYRKKMRLINYNQKVWFYITVQNRCNYSEKLNNNFQCFIIKRLVSQSMECVKEIINRNDEIYLREILGVLV